MLISNFFLESNNKCACNEGTEQKVPTKLIASRLRFAASVLQRMEAEEEEEEEDVFPDSFLMGNGRFAAGGGFNLSVVPVDKVVSAGFFTFSGPEELPSNTIRGLFLLWLLPELNINKQQ